MVVGGVGQNHCLKSTGGAEANRGDDVRGEETVEKLHDWGEKRARRALMYNDSIRKLGVTERQGAFTKIPLRLEEA